MAAIFTRASHSAIENARRSRFLRIRGFRIEQISSASGESNTDALKLKLGASPEAEHTNVLHTIYNKWLDGLRLDGNPA